MRPSLSVKFCELQKLFKHLPQPMFLQLQGNLKTVFNQIEQAIDYVAPVPTPPATTATTEKEQTNSESPK
jgi:hypothetical protein